MTATHAGAADGALSPETMLELMAYADGELDGEDLARVETLIASNPEAERLVSTMHTLGDCLRVTEGERRIPKIVDRIADDVMAKVEAEKERRKVVPLAPRPIRVRNAIVAGTVSAIVAIAAGWAMFVRPPDEIPAPVALAPAVKAPVAPPAVTPPEGTTPEGTGVDLNQVESPAGQVSVFYVPAIAAGGLADENVSSVVLWLGPDGPDGKGK